MDEKQRNLLEVVRKASKEAGVEIIKGIHYSKLTGKARVAWAEERREINLEIYNPRRLCPIEQRSRIGTDYELRHLAYQIMTAEEIISCENYEHHSWEIQKQKRLADEERIDRTDTKTKNIYASSVA